MIESAMPQGLLEDERVHAAWALFFSKFIEAYKDLVRAGERNAEEALSPFCFCQPDPNFLPWTYVSVKFSSALIFSFSSNIIYINNSIVQYSTVHQSIV